MPLKNTGKTIAKIKINKKNVVITFTDHSKLNVANEVMANFYLYEGKQLANKDINEIVSFSENAVLIKYAFSLLRKSHYSEWKMREKLYNKDAKKKDVDKIIKILKNADLLDDKAYAEDLKCYLEEKNYGKKKILNYLNEKGIFEENTKFLKFPISMEKKKAYNQLLKLEKKYAKYPYEQKRQHIYNALISLGFEHDIALDTLNKMSSVKQKDELEKLEKDFYKVIRKYENKYEGKELRQKIISSLKNKGYKMKDILGKLEEYDGKNDFGI